MSSKRRSPTPAPTSAKSTRTVLHQPGQQGSPTVSEAADCNAYDALISLPERTADAILADERTLSTRSAPNGRTWPAYQAAKPIPQHLSGTQATPPPKSYRGPNGREQCRESLWQQ